MLKPNIEMIRLASHMQERDRELEDERRDVMAQAGRLWAADVERVVRLCHARFLNRVAVERRDINHRRVTEFLLAGLSLDVRGPNPWRTSIPANQDPFLALCQKPGMDRYRAWSTGQGAPSLN